MKYRIAPALLAIALTGCYSALPEEGQVYQLAVTGTRYEVVQTGEYWEGRIGGAGDGCDPSFPFVIVSNIDNVYDAWSDPGQDASVPVCIAADIFRDAFRPVRLQ